MDSPLVEHEVFFYVRPLRGGGPRSGGGVARQQVKDSHPIPAYAVLPLKGKKKENALPVLHLKEFFFLCPPLEGRGTASAVVGWQR